MLALFWATVYALLAAGTSLAVMAAVAVMERRDDLAEERERRRLWQQTRRSEWPRRR